MTINNISKRTSTNRDIYRSLKAMILSGELAPGTALKQAKLAVLYNVSKIPIRETLKQLEADGLVTFKGLRGAFVMQHSIEDILEMMDIRIALECRAVEIAIANMTHSDLAHAKRLLTEHEQCSDIEKRSELNRQFHDSLYSPCGLPKMVSMIRNISEQTGLYIRMEVTMASEKERTNTEHEQIFYACEAGDAERASQLLKTHIEHTKKEVQAHFRRQTLSRH